jgi:K(+)-stimulated pyrophosphate-energized sodium pump
LLLETVPIVIALVISVVGIGFVIYQMRRVLAEDQGNQTMREISQAIQVGASAFLRREYTYLAVFVVVVALIVGAFINWQTAVNFVVGALISAAAGYLGMYVAVRANVRTAAAAARSLNDGLRVAFGSGSVMGMAVVSFGLLGLSLMYLVFAGSNDPAALTAEIGFLAGFGFGASSIALFARVGGGIYTKAADVGADLVGKVEAGIPEDDPRNPAVIADNVGDNVGDVAGMGADLFESYVGSIIAAAALGVALVLSSQGRCGVRLCQPALPDRRRRYHRLTGRHLPGQDGRERHTGATAGDAAPLGVGRLWHCAGHLTTLCVAVRRALLLLPGHSGRSGGWQRHRLVH